MKKMKSLCFSFIQSDLYCIQMHVYSLLKTLLPNTFCAVYSGTSYITYKASERAAAKRIGSNTSTRSVNFHKSNI